jgi:ATP-binding cassette subfamily B multidrug efflux pump
MDKGAIIEQGSHEELMAARGFYYDLYASQFEGALEEAS